MWGNQLQLPPQRENEPEWLQVQRRRKRDDCNRNRGGLAAMALYPTPYAIWEVFRAPPFLALILAVAATTAAIILSRRAVKGSFQRAFATWSFVAHAPSALIFLAMTVRQFDVNDDFPVLPAVFEAR